MAPITPLESMREIVQLVLIDMSLLLGVKPVRMGNKFNGHAILEVAPLLSGIVICIQPALLILLSPRRKPKHRHTSEFFQITETLSAVLDNAPLHPGTSASGLVQNRKYLVFQTGVGNDRIRSLQNSSGL